MFCQEDGRPWNPDHVSKRFKKLAAGHVSEWETPDVDRYVHPPAETEHVGGDGSDLIRVREVGVEGDG